MFACFVLFWIIWLVKIFYTCTCTAPTLTWLIGLLINLIGLLINLIGFWIFFKEHFNYKMKHGSRKSKRAGGNLTFSAGDWKTFPHTTGEEASMNWRLQRLVRSSWVIADEINYFNQLEVLTRLMETSVINVCWNFICFKTLIDSLRI